MPQGNAGVISGSSPEPTISRQGTGPSNQAGEKKTPESVPYERLSEVVSEKNAYKQMLTEERAERIRERQEIAALQRQMSQPKASAAPAPSLDDHPLVKKAIAQLGGGDIGLAAYEAIRDVMLANDDIRKPTQSASKSEILNEVKGYVESKFSGLSNTVKTSNRITDWVSKGLVSKDGAEKISAKVRNMVDNDPNWANHMDVLASHVKTSMEEAGEITRPSKAPPRTPPLSYDGNSPSPQASEDDLITARNEIRSKFRSLRGKSDADFDKLSIGNQPAVDSPEGAVPEFLVGRYRGGERI